MLESDILIENILTIAETRPENVFARLHYPNNTVGTISYGHLIRESNRFANYYADRGVKKNSVVIIILKHGPELIYSFVGALLYGAIPSIFAFPSNKVPKDVYAHTLDLLLKICDTRHVVTYRELAEDLPTATDLPDLNLLIDAGFKKFPDTFGVVPTGKTDVVLLQHSSGTTGLKKGVALSNQAVINQLRHYAQAIRLTPDDRIASWLPLYHDMGLIACFVLPLATGTPLDLMSPFDWVARPAMLFEVVTEQKSTLCWLPNFSYNFLAANIEEDEIKNVRLDSLRAVVNCAEPVRHESHEIFLGRFVAAGFKRSALATCYAMAENTFAVTQGGITEPVKTEKLPGSERICVSSGTLIHGNKLKIVDEKFTPLPDGRVGEILIQSDSMLTGYYHRDDLTKEAIVDGWYRTGDLGFVSDNHLFVTGRKKDMIIVAGKNIYPQDIEELVSSVPGIKAGRVASFGVPNDEAGTEDVVIVAETDGETAPSPLNLKLAVAKIIRDRLECVANDIVLLPPMSLLKSSSGKIARSANREKYLKEWRGKNVVR